jgi:hypothetical protein
MIPDYFNIHVNTYTLNINVNDCILSLQTISMTVFWVLRDYTTGDWTTVDWTTVDWTTVDWTTVDWTTVD